MLSVGLLHLIHHDLVSVFVCIHFWLLLQRHLLLLHHVSLVLFRVVLCLSHHSVLLCPRDKNLY